MKVFFFYAGKDNRELLVSRSPSRRVPALSLRGGDPPPHGSEPSTPYSSGASEVFFRKFPKLPFLLLFLFILALSLETTFNRTALDMGDGYHVLLSPGPVVLL